MIWRAVIFAFVLLSAALIGGNSRAQELPVQPLQTLSLPPKNLIGDQPGGTNPPAWKSSMTFGFIMTQGNSDTLLVTGKLLTKRKSNFNEWLLGADGAYGENDSVKNRETLHGFAQFNHFFNSRLYVFGRVDGLHDGIKDIKYRFTSSTGLGYFLVQRTNTSFVVEAGPSLVSEQQGDQIETYFAARLAERFDYRLNPAARVWQSAEFIPQVDQTSNFILNVEVGIETVITKELSLQVVFQDNFVNQPASTYKNNDIRLVSGLSYKF